MINWPKSLVREIARRRVVLFLGAGVSATSTDSFGNRPKTWKNFLIEVCSLVHDTTDQSTIKKLIEDNQFLLALQAISEEANTADYRDILNSNFNNPNFEPSDIHEIILALDASIVITTNFDKIYERYCESTSTDGYKVVSYNDRDLGDLVRSDDRLIVKAHGSINNIGNMIFTKSQYHEAKKNYPQFYELLKAIFLTHTCVFIGCGLDDPDVLLMLEDVKITSSGDLPHYAVFLESEVNKFATRDWKKAYNIDALTYGPSYDGLKPNLEQLLEKVEEFRSTKPLS
ncbi:SIR2 family protein [Pseudoalteromonas sp. S3776]|uniref:SIR2 family protein n=1 Tax=Pseudoalteromonas sp. S3776 TaxID=579544 RepID=UPI001107D678|nr:SIR2 family protein [Pseudoalteromonas sp. S3776]TMO80052.1 SIR2 family protein [Pseudoalteromonas sp. S3776]